MWISQKRWDALVMTNQYWAERTDRIVEAFEALKDLNQELHRQLEEGRQRHVDALERMVQMRREGFEPPMPVLSDTKPEALAVDITAAIVAVAGEAGPLSEQLVRNAYKRVEQGWETEAVVKEVYDGQDVDKLLG